MTRIPVKRRSAIFLLAALACGLSAEAESLSIEAACAAVRASSEAVRARRLGVQKSQAQHSQAVSQALPRLTLEATGAYMTNPPEISIAKGELGTFTTPLGSFSVPENDVSFTTQPENTYFKLDATLSQPLFTWGKIAGAITLASLAVEAAGSELRGEERAAERDVHAAYFGALLAERSKAVLSGMRDTLEGILQDRQKSFAEGTITRQQVLEAESNLASLEKKITDAEEGMLTAYESLGMLTGKDPGAITLATDFRKELPPLDEEVLKEEAVRTSSDIELGRTRVNQARARLDVERGGSVLLPDFSFIATLEATGGRIPFIGTNWTDTWNLNLIIGIGTKVRIFDGGESTGKAEAAARDVEAAAEALSGVEKKVRLSIRSAMQAARSAAAETREKSAGLALAEEQAKNARVSFENGLATREESNSAQIALARARLDDLLSAYNLEAALGELEYRAGERLPRGQESPLTAP